MNPPIAIVGASARAAAASAARAGFQPITADLFADVDLRAIATATRVLPYPEGLMDWLRTVEPPAWMYTGALENHAELVDQMAWIAPLWGNSGDVLDRVRSPWQLAAALRNAGLRFPETRRSADGLPRDGSWLSKTCRGASGSGVRELIETGEQKGNSGGQEDKESTRYDPPASSSFVYQRRIAGTPCAAAFIAAGGRVQMLGVTRQLVGEDWLGARGFQYAGSIGPLSTAAAAQDALAKIGRVLADQFELVGLFGVDFILTENEVWTVEVNPRYTASVEILERATGLRAIRLHARACVDGELHEQRAGASPPPSEALKRKGGDAPTRSDANAPVHGKAILYAKRDVVLTESFAEAALAEVTESLWPGLADVSPAGAPIEAGRPVLTLFASGADPVEVERRLRRRAAELEGELYHSEATP